jgi:hypothetical protein
VAEHHRLDEVGVILYLDNYKGKLCHTHRLDGIFQHFVKLTIDGGPVRSRLADKLSLVSKAPADANTIY